LPYGYTLGPLIARHIMKPLVTRWRLLQIKNICFFDDGMAVDSNYEFLEKASLQMHCDLIRAGLIPGLTKCTWLPSKELEWNGLTWNFNTKQLSVKSDRVQSFKSLLQNFMMKWPSVTFRDISKLTGTLISMFPVFNGLEQLYTRHLQSFINIRHFNEYYWDRVIVSETPVLFTLCLEELKFWIHNFDKVNYRNFTPSVPTRLGWVDASAYATGGLIVEMKEQYMKRIYTMDSMLGIQNNSAEPRHVDFVYRALEHAGDVRTYVVQHRMLDKYEIKTDSNERELLGGLHLIKSNLTFLRNTCFTLHFDNENAHIILCKGSTKPRLHKYATEIRNLCFEHNIKLFTIGIPRSINETADFLSKFYDKDDFSCKDSFFQFVEKSFNLHCNFDRFASNLNTKCTNFNSLTNCLGTSGVDCFKYHWGSPFVNWLFPPPRLVIRCINHLRACKGIALLLVPEWKTSDFYPALLKLDPECAHLKRFSGKNVFRVGSDPTSHFSDKFNAAVNVWCLNFNHV
jgi:hypothetical protein